MQQPSFENIPNDYLEKWQEIADLIANILSVSAALIMKTEKEFMEVFISSKTKNNPYQIGDKKNWHGLYCETVIKTSKKLHIPNALKDKNWDKSPDAKLGMIAYLGFPLSFPDDRPFGTLCVLDKKERLFNRADENLLLQFKKVIELDLALICALELKENNTDNEIIQKLLGSKEECRGMNEELQQANEELKQAKQRAEENEKKYRRIADNVIDVVWITDLEMKPTYISPSVERVLGVKPEEYLKQPITRTYPLASIEKFKNALEEQFAKEQDPEANKNRVFGLEVERYYADGTLGWDTIKATFIRDKQMNPIAIQGVSHDITERRRAEEKLKAEHKRLNFLMEVTGTHFNILDAEYNILDVDLAWQKIYGDFHGRKCHEYFMRLNKPCPGCGVPKAFETKDIVVTEEFLPTENKYFEVHTVPFQNEQGEWLCAEFNIDITERKKTEEALREKNNLLERLFNSNFDLIALCDLEGNFTLVGKSHEILGYDIEYLVGKNVMEFVHPDDVDAISKEFYSFLQSGDNRKVEYRYKRIDGTYLWFETVGTLLSDEKGKPEQILFNTRNITERKQAEEVVHESEALLSDVMESIQDGISVLDPDLNIIRVNSIMKKWYESKTPLVGKKCFQCYHNAEKPCNPCPSLRCLKSGKTEVDIINGPPGSPIKWIELFSYPIKSSQTGDIIGLVEFVRDITDRRQAEESLKTNFALLQIAGETARFGGWSVDLDKNIATWSDAVADIHEVPHGYAPPVEEAINFYAPRWRDKIAKVFGDCAQNGIPYDEEMEIITSKGKYVWVRANGRAMRDKSGKITTVQGSFQDITIRKRSEQALLESEKKMRSIYSVAPTGIGVVVNRVLKEVNPRICEMTGYSREELIDKNAQLLYPSLDEYELVGKEKYEQIRKTGTGKVETRWQKKDRTIINVLLASTPIDKNDYSKGVTFTALDITKRKLAEAALKESEERFRHLLRDIPWIAVQGYRFDGTVIYWNKASEDLYGYSTKEALGQKLYELIIPPEMRDNVRDEIQQMHETMKPIPSAELSLMRKNGSRVSVISSHTIVQRKGHPPELFCLDIDITNRKKAEERLKESEERFKALHNASFGGIAIHDKGVILECNQGLSEMTGYSLDELIGMDGLLLIAPESRDTVMENILKGYEKPYEVVGLRKNSETYPVRLEARNIPYKGKRVRTVEFRDITERKKAEELLQAHSEKIQAQNEQYESINEELRQTNDELFEAKEKAEESDRLKTAFLQNMSHEIRTPLNAISGFSGMLSKPKLNHEKREKFVSIIQNSSQQLVSIITDILTISSLDTKQEHATITEVCINSIIEELLSIFKTEAQKQNLTFEAKIPLTNSQSVIYTDKTKITQILSNFIANALKFTHKGFVEFGYELINGPSAPEKYKSMLRFYVKDTGIGIPPEKHEKIFERFQQAHNSTNNLYGGTGLGLSISKGFAELLGGTIGVQSAPKKGSTFYFTIPYNPVKEADNISPGTSQNISSATILIAEDEDLNFLLIKEFLDNPDLKLIHAKDGQETLDFFRENPQIDLILMDIKMPKVSGDEAAGIIKKLKPSLPIIAQTAYVLEQEAERFLDVFDDYLIKPINQDILKQTVNKYINMQKK